MSFLAATTPTHLGNGRFTVEIPDGWQQGKGAFGGVVVALLVRAIQQEQEEGRRLRSFSAHLCGPLLNGPASLQTDVLRRGAGISTVACRLMQDGVCAHGVADFGRDRAPDLSLNEWQMPTVPSWKDVAAVDMPVGIAPVFTQHFEYRPIEGLPFSGGRAETCGWVRAKKPGKEMDAALLAALVDSWWISAWVTFSAPRPAATIAYFLHGIADTSRVDPEIPVFYRAKSTLLAEGYTVEQRELWSEDGTLLVINQQTQAIIK